MPLRLCSAVPIALALVLHPGSAVGAVAPAFQAGTVAGVVLSGRGYQPLPGAQVSIVGTPLRAVTGPTGRFRIEGVSGSPATLRVILIGYSPVEQPVRAGEADVRIVMQEAIIKLEELVVTGTPGEVQRRSLGNTVAKVGLSETLELAPASRGLDALMGRAPGVTLVKASGAAGEGGRIRIRGVNSLSLSNEPLIYVDGARVDGGNRSAPGDNYWQSAHRLNDIPVDEIESIEVIKGPAAATLYGTEAAAGVIQIITKKGSPGRPRITANVQQGANWVPNPEGRFRTNYRRNPDGSLFTYNASLDEARRGFPIWQTGQVQDYGLEIAGGTENVQYFVGGGWQGEAGVQHPNQVDRYRLRTNVKAILSPKLDASVTLGYSSQRTDFAQVSVGVSAAWWPTMNPLAFQPDGRYFQLGPTPGEYAAAESEYENLKKFTGGVQFNHNPTKWFSHRLTVGLDQNTQEQNIVAERQVDPRLLRVLTDGLGRHMLDNYSSQTNTVDYAGTLTVPFPLFKRLESKTSVGAQYYRQYIETNRIDGRQFPAPGVTAISAAAQRLSSGTFVENITVGTYVQQQFSLNNRLFLVGAIRADDNSAFGEDFNLVTYPKISGAWVISEEPFWPLRFLNTFRLRGAYGRSGKQPVSFAALRTYQPIVSLGDQPGVRPASIGNPSLGPEVGSEFEAGFEASVLKDRLGVEFTYYDKRTQDLILNIQVPPSIGFRTARPENLGEVKNTGFEIRATAVPVSTKQLRWDASLSLAQNSNAITDMGGLAPLNFVSQQARQGFPVYGFFGKEVVSGDVSANGNTITLANAKCDGGRGRDGLEPGGPAVPCAQAPAIYLGRPTPEFDGALTTGVTLYNRLRFDALVDYAINVWTFDWITFGPCVALHQCAENVLPDSALANPLAFAEGVVNQNAFTGRRLHPDRSYARLRSLSASWSVPDSWARSVGVRSATITLSGRNLWLLWDRNYQGLDPDIWSRNGSYFGEGGSTSHYAINFWPTPLNRQVSMTVRLGF